MRPLPRTLVNFRLIRANIKTGTIQQPKYSPSFKVCRKMFPQTLSSHREIFAHRLTANAAYCHLDQSAVDLNRTEWANNEWYKECINLQHDRKVLFTAMRSIRLLKALCFALLCKLTNTCKTHDECVGQTICYEEKCVPAMPTPDIKYCDDKQKCDESKHETCRFGLCMVPFASDKPVTPTPISTPIPTTTPQPDPKCEKHTDCPETKLCEENKCVDAEPTETACSDAAPCASTQVCRKGLCWKKYIPPIEGHCNVHTDCPDNQLCMNNMCKMSIPAHDCTDDKNCQQGASCKNGKCWKIACVKHDDCEPPQLCNAKQECKQAKRKNGRCTTDAECGANAGCKLNFCWEFI
uniref:EB domain-containing protein n=1 Tax=Trichuris muris TaxID=70415 RepID=A0A5S6R1E6_TRIMR